MVSKRDDDDARAHWDDLHRQARFRPRYPNDHVVRFLYGAFSDEASRRGKTALDIAVGGGRHTRLLCEMGFHVSGVDISPEGIKHAGEWLASEGFTATLKEATMASLPFDDASFDVVLAFGVFNYTDKAGLKQAVTELRRVLRPGATALVVLRTTSDYRAGKGASLEPNTFRLEIRDTNEFGSVQHFLDEAEVVEEFGGFAKLAFEKSETTFNDRQGVNSDWLIRVTK